MYQIGHKWKAVAWLAVVVCVICAASAVASDWPMQGADAGMTKYSSANLSADGNLQLSYRKRFYTDWRSYSGNYYYGSSVVVRNGQAVLFCNDQDDPRRTEATRIVSFTKFDWPTGQALAHFDSPFYWEEHALEIDSHHFTNAMVWHSDGRIYGRRGGDRTKNWSLDLTTGLWTEVPLVIPPDGASWGGDTNGFLRTYGNHLIYRYGDTRDIVPYAVYDISPAAWTNGTQGAYQLSIGFWRRGLYAGDIPKMAQNMVVIGGCDMPGLTLIGCNVDNTNIRWTRSFASDNSNAMDGMGASIPDYWRFVASDEGYYVFYTRAMYDAARPVLRAVNITTGQDVWSYTMTDAHERPLLACHNGALFVIGRSQQLKMSLATGQIQWERHINFPDDAGYLHTNYADGGPKSSDHMYRPMVLTDDSMWFVNGATRGKGTLVGIQTSDGSVIQQIDLAGLYSGTETLDYVNDVMTADGRLGVLLSVSDSNDPRHIPAYYQDLFVYQVAPANTKTITSAAGPGGSINPPRSVTVSKGASQTFTISPNGSYTLKDVLVDGVSVGQVTSYTFTNVTANHTITASFGTRASMVRWWKLDDAAGTHAADSSGNGGTADLVNGPTWTNGILGGGLNLGANEGYLVNAQDMTSQFFNRDLTIALWFKATAAGVVASESGDHSPGSTDWNVSLIEVMDDGEVRVRVENVPSVSLGRVGWGTWHHAVVRYDGNTQILDGFLDGVKSTGQSTGVRWAPWDRPPEWYDLYYAFGYMTYEPIGTGHCFTGSLDDVRIYNGPLPAEDVADLATPASATCTLSIVNAGPGSGTVTFDPPGGVYTAGQVVTLTAVPAANNTFGGWGQDLRGMTNPATIRVNADRVVTATFTRLPLVGDINADGFVNVGDLQLLVATWGRTNGELGYDSRGDLDGNRIVNVGDLQVLVAHWAEHY